MRQQGTAAKGSAMQINRRHMILAALAGAMPWPARAGTDQALVAVATNFAKTAEKLRPVFEAQSGYKITLANGSTGKLYAQITNGAPYDMLLAADQLRPHLLEQAGLGFGRLTYARGLLALWQPDGAVDEATLRAGAFTHLAIANPALAPYGLAAREALENMGLWQVLQGKIVMGQNVGQAFALVASGNAQLGLVAQSYALGQGAGWQLPEAFYNPILQDAVLLGENPAAVAFATFLGSEAAQQIIREAGYGEVPA